MAQWLRDLTALAEDPGSVLDTHLSQSPVAPADPLPISGFHGQLHTDAHTHTQTERDRERERERD